MARLKQKGKAGAAKAYVTRTAAVKKLQISLADFRRLCILKGIFPREPRSRKKANKGSSAPTSFYYAKDIAYIAHEPILKKLREHKAFAKKLSRAIGRGDWGDAQNLESHKPAYKLDHVIKERYPTFIDAVRDIDDALCMIFLFASLPSNDRVPPSLTENCSRLAAEWQLYVMNTKSLRKVFLSIKGIYYQAEIMDQNVTWLVPYQFAQSIPTDVDVRVMLTFLELYQTLLGFVFFKLYTDRGLVYPPPLDDKKDALAAGIGAFTLLESTKNAPAPAPRGTVQVDGRKISGKDVRETIKALANSTPGDDVEMAAPETIEQQPEEEEFVAQPSSKDMQSSTDLPTLQSLSSLPPSLSTSLFAPYTFFISRETSRSIFEFVVRSFGGRVGWPASSGAGSPFDETDDSITHYIIDRPLVEKPNETTEERQRRLRRKYIQPQWVIDCINAGKILLEEPYEQGKTLPPHLSPFGEYEGAYDPLAANVTTAQDGEESDEEVLEGEDEADKEEDEEDEDEEMKEVKAKKPKKSGPVIQPISNDPADIRAAELALEAAGMDYGAFEKEVAKSRKAAKQKEPSAPETEHNMNKMMMSNKQKKLYERMKHSQKKKADEKALLEQRRKEINKKKRREAKAS